MPYKKSELDYVVTYRWMREILELKGNELMIYAIIYGYSKNGEGEFYGGIQYLQDWTGATKKTVIVALESLVEKNLVHKFDGRNREMKTCSYAVDMSKVPLAVDRTIESDCTENEYTGVKITPLTGEQDIKGVKILDKGVVITPNNKYKESIERNKEKILKEKKEFEVEAVSETEVAKQTSQLTDEKKAKKKKKSENKTPNCEEYRQMVLDRNYEDRLRDRLLAWLDYKTERGDTYTPSGWSMMLKRVDNETANYSLGKMCKCIDECISREYKGIIFDLMEKMPTQRPKYQRLD